MISSTVIIIINYKTSCDRLKINWLLSLDDLEVVMSSDMTSLKQKQEIVLQKLSKANGTVQTTDYTIMHSAFGVGNEWNIKLWKPWLQMAK